MLVSLQALYHHDRTASQMALQALLNEREHRCMMHWEGAAVLTGHLRSDGGHWGNSRDLTQRSFCVELDKA